MARVNRFVWVRSARGDVKHMSPRGLDGDVTRCGRIVVAHKWVRVPSAELKHFGDCADCVRSKKP